MDIHLWGIVSFLGGYVNTLYASATLVWNHSRQLKPMWSIFKDLLDRYCARDRVQVNPLECIRQDHHIQCTLQDRSNTGIDYWRRNKGSAIGYNFKIVSRLPDQLILSQIQLGGIIVEKCLDTLYFPNKIGEEKHYIALQHEDTESQESCSSKI